MSLSSGSQLGPYTIEREIGRGGMGVVYLGRDTRLDRAVAIKSLPEHLAADQERLARFEREAKVLATLNHPNVAGIYGVEEQDGAKYLILEYVEGETLADRLDRGSIQPEEAVEVALQIAAGVEAAHEAGVIHRDLKPANIKFDRDGAIKVLDFGLARADESSTTGSSMSQLPTLTSPANSPTVAGVILGTAAYMSPEQARGRRVDKRSDIWSFGVVLYEMLTGAGPFRGETVTDSIGAILHKDVEFNRLPASTPSGVRHVIGRCLERDKAKRYRDIGDASYDLRFLSATEVAPAKPAISGWHLVLLATAVIVAASVGWMLASRTPQSRGEELAHLGIPVDRPPTYSGPPEPFYSLDPTQRRLAYVGRNPVETPDFNQRIVFIRDFDDPIQRPVRGTEGADMVSFSPDGTQLAYTWNQINSSRHELRRIGVDGLASITLLSDESGFQYIFHEPPRWLDNETIILTKGDRLGYVTIDVSSGELTEFFNVSDHVENALLSEKLWVSPDGTYLLFSVLRRHEEGEMSGDVFKHSLETNETELVLQNGVNAVVDDQQLVFIREDTLCVAPWDDKTREVAGPVRPLYPGLKDGTYAVSPRGDLVFDRITQITQESRLLSVDLTGGDLQVVSSDYKEHLGQISLSPDGMRIASSVAYSDTPAIDVLDLETGFSQRVSDATQVSLFPMWASNSQLVYSQPQKIDDFDHVLHDIDSGTQPELLFDSEENWVDGAILTPNGRWAISCRGSASSGQSDIFAIDRQGEGGVIPLAESSADEFRPRLSMDGTLLSYRRDAPDQDALVVRRFDEDNPSRDSQAVRISSGAVGFHFWSTVENAVYWVDLEPRPRELKVTRFDTESRLRVLSTETVLDADALPMLSPPGPQSMIMSKDGTRFIFVEESDRAERSEFLHVVLNWTSQFETD